MMPRCAAREIPDTIAIGTASSSGHGVATTRTDRARIGVARRPGDAGDDERDRHEDRGVAVGEPDERSLLPLRLLHEPDDPGVRAVLGRGRRQQVERAAGVDRPGPDRVTGGAFDRARLPRERRLVQDGVRRGDAVDRDHGARLHEQPVAAAHRPRPDRSTSSPSS